MKVHVWLPKVKWCWLLFCLPHLLIQTGRSVAKTEDIESRPLCWISHNWYHWLEVFYKLETNKTFLSVLHICHFYSSVSFILVGVDKLENVLLNLTVLGLFAALLSYVLPTCCQICFLLFLCFYLFRTCVLKLQCIEQHWQQSCLFNPRFTSLWTTKCVKC